MKMNNLLCPSCICHEADSLMNARMKNSVSVHDRYRTQSNSFHSAMKTIIRLGIVPAHASDPCVPLFFALARHHA